MQLRTCGLDLIKIFDYPCIQHYKISFKMFTVQRVQISQTPEV